MANETPLPRNNKLAKYSPADLAVLKDKASTAGIGAESIEQCNKYVLLMDQIDVLLTEEVNELIK